MGEFDMAASKVKPELKHQHQFSWIDILLRRYEFLFFEAFFPIMFAIKSLRESHWVIASAIFLFWSPIQLWILIRIHNRGFCRIEFGLLGTLVALATAAAVAFST